MRRFIVISLLAATVVTLFPAPEAQAFDPVTLAILAPIAIRVAERTAPYVYRGVRNTGNGLLKIGKDVLHLFYFPFGLGYMCCGNMRRGLVYVIRGGIAPGQLVFHTLLLPVLMVGVNINM